MFCGILVIGTISFPVWIGRKFYKRIYNQNQIPEMKDNDHPYMLNPILIPKNAAESLNEKMIVLPNTGYTFPSDEEIEKSGESILKRSFGENEENGD